MWWLVQYSWPVLAQLDSRPCISLWRSCKAHSNTNMPVDCTWTYFARMFVIKHVNTNILDSIRSSGNQPRQMHKRTRRFEDHLGPYHQECDMYRDGLQSFGLFYTFDAADCPRIYWILSPRKPQTICSWFNQTEHLTFFVMAAVIEKHDIAIIWGMLCVEGRKYFERNAGYCTFQKQNHVNLLKEWNVMSYKCCTFISACTAQLLTYRLISTIHEDLLPTTKTRSACLLMLFREIIIVYHENYINPINTLCGQNAKLLCVK
jgi:hypothetical protein